MRYQRLLFLLLGIAIGIALPRISPTLPAPQVLRLGPDQFINPLLACNINNSQTDNPLRSLESSLTQLVHSHIEKTNITQSGIYLRDLNSATSITINDQQKFYPASLNKIPIMIGAYKIAENNPDFLSQQFQFTPVTDLNLQQEILPTQTLISGQTYSIQDAITTMITESDNHGFYALTKQLDPQTYQQTHHDLQIPLMPQTQTVTDYLTPEQFSYFFRVLYNATYLNNHYSNQALKLLSQVKYKNGLRASIPDEIPISHKFGLLTNATNNQVTSRELHDCGIVYYPNNPYLLCIMTKSTNEITQIESFIQEVSQTVYNHYQNLNQE